MSSSSPAMSLKTDAFAVIADKNGVRRAPWRFSLGKLNCFR